MSNLYLRNRTCFVVNGFNRAIIYDLNRSDYYFVPLPLYDKIEKNNEISFKEDDIEAKEWEAFLLEKEIIFPIDTKDEKSLFPGVSTKFEIPNLISCVILHDNFNQNLLHNFESLHLLNVSVIVDNYNKQKNLTVLQKLAQYEIDSIYLYLTEENRNYDANEFDYLNSIPQVFNIYLFGNSQKKELNPKEETKYTPINVVPLPQTFENYSSSMIVEKMQVNYNHFFEAYNHHNYFNQKVYIDTQGNIKNGLNNQESFGNINSITKNDFSELIGSKKFQKLWNVKKEDTLVCKDCEFRFMCVDPRVPKQNNNGQWYHTQECNYNPYISKWKNEDGYKTLSESGVSISDSGELSVDKQTLKKTFETAWS